MVERSAEETAIQISTRHPRLLLVLALALLGLAPARAVQDGTLTRDLTVGTANDIHLKSGTAVHVMRLTATKAVIMTTLADGSNGIFEVDASAVAVTAPTTPPPAPAPAPLIAPAPTPTIAPVAAPQPVAPPAPSGPPTWPDDFVGGPEFVTKAGTQGAGTASLIRLKDGTQCYLASAPPARPRRRIQKAGGCQGRPHLRPKHRPPFLRQRQPHV